MVTAEAVDHLDVRGTQVTDAAGDARRAVCGSVRAEDVERGHLVGSRGAAARRRSCDPGGRAVHHDRVLGAPTSFDGPHAQVRASPATWAATKTPSERAAAGVRRCTSARRRLAPTPSRSASAAVNGRSIGRGASSPRSTASRAHGGMTCMRTTVPARDAMRCVIHRPARGTKSPGQRAGRGTKCPVSAAGRGTTVPDSAPVGQKMISPALRRLRSRATASSRMSAASVSLRRSFT